MKSSHKTLRVLQIIPRLNMGGAERGTIELAGYLKTKGIESFVASSGGQLVPLLTKEGVLHECIPVHSKNPVTILLNIFRLRRLIKTHKINVIDVRSRAPAWSTYFAVRKTHAKLITTFHGMYGHQNFLKRLYNRVMIKGTRIVAVSQFIRHHLEDVYKVNPQKIVAIPRGVDLSIFGAHKVPQSRLETLTRLFQLPEDKLIILMPGRLSRLKGHEVLLEALSYLKNKNYICVFVGKSKNAAYEKELTEQAVTYGVRDKLFIKESCSDMPALYKLATVTVTPSIWPESFGRTIAEAGSMGCPTIASNHGGAREIIVHEETGYLFPAEDSRALASYIDKVLSFTKKERETMAHKAIAHIQRKFSNKQMFEKTVQVYKDVLS